MQRTANPCTAVRFRFRPPPFCSPIDIQGFFDLIGPAPRHRAEKWASFAGNRCFFVPALCPIGFRPLQQRRRSGFEPRPVTRQLWTAPHPLLGDLHPSYDAICREIGADGGSGILDTLDRELPSVQLDKALCERQADTGPVIELG
jgi:hypothetical protein